MNGPLLLSSVLFGAAVAVGAGPLLALINRLNRAFFDRLAARRQELGMPTDDLRALEIGRWVAAAIPGVLLAGLGLIPVAVMAAVVAYNLYGARLLWQVEAYQLRIRDQLVLAARDFSNQIRATPALRQALEQTCEGLEEPLGPLLHRVVEQARRDPDQFTRALESLKNAVRLDGMTVFVTAVLIAQRQGGDLSLILDRLSLSLEELQRVERRRDTATAAGWAQVVLMSSFPFVFLIGFYLLDPEATGLLFTLISGQIILSLVGLMVYGSYRWALSILKNVE